ncbi:hypothetical protein ACPEEZ_06250 [Frigoribacterium sp. 2-23]|uniref:hypothetical protein n=1 Tax=Frigoribacterium sp. 2-23 TaxID=3415006 RepID=UPI003C6F5E0B
MRKLLAALTVLVVIGAATAIGAVAVTSTMSMDVTSGPIEPPPPACPDVPPVDVDGITVPAGPVAGYCQDRLVNAAWIIVAARAQGIGVHTQAIGVMTAMGESSLRNLDYGDTVGPDSRGLFQQRDNGAWGSYDDRMTPYTAATMFFTKLVKTPGWKDLTPTQAAHTVQVNADPDHYTPYWEDAVTVVTALSPDA